MKKSNDTCNHNLLSQYLDLDKERYYFKIIETVSNINETKEADNHLSLAGADVDMHVEIVDKIRAEELTTLQLISEFCSLGHAPSITLWNSTWRQVFTSADDVYNACDAWETEFLRSKVSRSARVPTSTEQWMLIIELDTGVELFTTIGTLIDIGIEPILQWNPGDLVADLPAEAKEHTVTSIIVRSPCAADVAAIFPVIKSDEDHLETLYIGVSYKGLDPGSIKWYQLELHDAPHGSYVVDAALTNQYLLLLLNSGLYVSNSLVEMEEREEEEHHEEEEDHGGEEEEEEEDDGHGHKRRKRSRHGKTKKIKFQALTNLRNKRADHREEGKQAPTEDGLGHKRRKRSGHDGEEDEDDHEEEEEEGHGEEEGEHGEEEEEGHEEEEGEHGEEEEHGKEIEFHEVHGPWQDHSKLSLIYTSNCLCREGDDMQSEIIMVGPHNQTGHSWCYMQPPYSKLNCFEHFHPEPGLSHFISLTYNAHMRGLTMAFETQGEEVAVHTWLMDDHYDLDHQSLHPAFIFPASFRLNKMEFHPKTNDLIAYGNEVWNSVDGGNYFHQLIVLENGDSVVTMMTGKQSGDIVLMTEQGHILYGKTGILRLAYISPSPLLFCLTEYVPLVDHINDVYLIGWCNDTDGEIKLKREKLNVTDILRDLDRAFPRTLVPLILYETNLFLFEYSPSDTKSKFHGSNVGQLVVLKNGGSAQIREVYHQTYDSRFVSVLRTFVHEPFYYENIQKSPAQLYDIGISLADVSHKTNVNISLTSHSAGNGWLATDVGKTIWVAGASSFLITAIQSSSQAEGISVLAIESLVTAKKGYWYMYDFGVIGDVPQWKLQEDECHQTLLPPDEIQYISYIELDIKHEFQATMVSSLKLGGIPYSQELHASFSNPWLFNIQPIYNIQANGHHSLQISLDAYVNRKGKSAINFKMSKSSLLCEKTAHTVTIASACPYGSRLTFHHEYHIENEIFLHGQQYNAKGIELLYDLPVNYRPPSVYGVEVPISDNFYNADLSKPRFHDNYKISKNTGTFKQCKEKTNRAGCGCTESMKLSADMSMSDCIERSYAVEHSADVMLRFTLDQVGKESINLTSKYILAIEEVNNRTNYACISDMTSSQHTVNDTGSRLRYLNPEQVSLVMSGSGLYHFKVHVLEGYSYCKLETQFLFYVTNTPIVHHLDMLILFSVAVLFGGGLSILYMKYLSLPDRTHERVMERKRIREMFEKDGGLRESQSEKYI